jgi:uncharacterized protein YjiK
MRSLAFAVALLVLPAVSGCGLDADSSTKSDDILVEREARLAASLASADSASARDQPIARWLLPSDLAEISGLALTADGRLFAHNDEMARVTEIDYRRGTIIKQFHVGTQNMRGDFEGLVSVGDRFFLLSSEGNLYEFREGADGERVDYRAHDTHLGKECEFEGLTYDANANAIVLACKNVDVRQYKDEMVLYRYPLDGTGEISALTVPIAQVVGENDWEKIRPTDITIDPSTGNYVLVAAQEKALLSITPAGEVLFSRALPSRHSQSEGIAITQDNILMISDESNRTRASLTLYRWSGG